MALLTSRTALAETPNSSDLLHIVDVSDTTDNVAGTSKKITVANLLGSLTGYFLKSTDDTDDISEGATNKFVTSAEKTKLSNLSGTNTGDQDLSALPTISSGAGAPVSTPTKVGDIYVDTTGDDAYIAVGTASSADWEKSNDGAGGGSGDVTKVGTPVDNQVGVWTGNGTIEGDTALTFDTATDTLAVPNLAIGTALLPDVNDGASLGVATTGEFSDLFLAEGGVINWDNGDITLTQTSNQLTLGGATLFTVGLSCGFTSSYLELGHASDTTLTRASAGVVAIEGNNIVTNTSSPTLATITTTGNIELGHASDTTISRTGAGAIAVEGVAVPTISSTNTLTNKRVTKRTGTTTSHATPTINTDNVDFYSITAQTEAITSFTTNLSGTPTEGQTLWIAITGTGARAITWGASFEASTVALPTTTVSTNRLDCGFVWNSVSSKWRCIASA